MPPILHILAVAWCIAGTYLADLQWGVLDCKVVHSNGDGPSQGALRLPHRPLLQAKALQVCAGLACPLSDTELATAGLRAGRLQAALPHAFHVHIVWPVCMRRCRLRHTFICSLRPALRASAWSSAAALTYTVDRLPEQRAPWCCSGPYCP